MNYAKILELLALAIPVFVAGTKKIIKGNEKYIFAIGLYFLLKKFAETAAQNEAKEKIQEVGQYNHNALAQLYRQAVNPSGYKYLMEFDGTNEEMIFDLATKTGNFQSVAVAYRSQYGTDLIEDLRKELSSADFSKFVGILNQVI